MDMFLVFDNLFSLLLGYYRLGLWLPLAGKRLKNFEKLIIGVRTILEHLMLNKS